MNTRNLQEASCDRGGRDAWKSESTHANRKCQEWPCGTCIAEPLVTATAANPTLAHSLFSVQYGLVHSQVTRQAACPCSSFTEKKQVYDLTTSTQEGFQPQTAMLCLCRKRKASLGLPIHQAHRVRNKTQQKKDATILLVLESLSLDFIWLSFSKHIHFYPDALWRGKVLCNYLIQDKMPAEIPFSRKPWGRYK